MRLPAYGDAATGQGAREQEAIAFRLAARRLRDAHDPRSRNAALGINHSIWMQMFRDLNDTNNRLPPMLKRDCLNLAKWSLDYSTRALLADLPLEPLISVNEDVAQGLKGEMPEGDTIHGHAKPEFSRLSTTTSMHNLA